MEARVLIEHMDQVPFQPFTIELENGRRCTVRHPENILFWPNRIRYDHVQAYDEDRRQTVYFGLVAVMAIRKDRPPEGELGV